MNPELAASITRDRLHLWAKRNARESICTPILLVSVGHGPQAGEIVLNVCEEVPLEHIASALRFALDHCRQQIAIDGARKAARQ